MTTLASHITANSTVCSIICADHQQYTNGFPSERTSNEGKSFMSRRHHWVHAKILSSCFISGFTVSHWWAIEQKEHTGTSLFYIVCYDDSLLDDQNQFVFILARSNWRSGNYHQDQVGSGVTKLNLFYTCCRRVIELCDTWRRVANKKTTIFLCHWKACSGDQIKMKPPKFDIAGPRDQYVLLNKLCSHFIMTTTASQITSLTIVYSTVYSGISKKTSKLRVTGLCVGNSPVTREFPAQRASNMGNVSIWWRHHDNVWRMTKGQQSEAWTKWSTFWRRYIFFWYMIHFTLDRICFKD